MIIRVCKRCFCEFENWEDDDEAEEFQYDALCQYCFNELNY